jgi:phosphate transport system substrate-binding protein
MLAVLSTRGIAQQLISIRGSVVVAQALAPAVGTLEKELGIQVNFVPEISGPDLADKLGQDIFDVALLTRPLTGQEKALRPDRKFTETLIGKHAILILVPDQVWKSGVRALRKVELRKIYEREVTNWKAFGGEDREILYYNRESGRGVWDLFMIFLYGDLRKAPLSKAEVLTTPEDVRTSVEFNGGSISLLEHGFMQGERLHALGIKQPDSSVVEPTPLNIAGGRYELSRPLYLVTSKQPTGKVRELIEFMLGPKGQEFVKQAGHVPLTVMQPKK